MTTSGPNVKYNSRESMDASLGRRVLSSSERASEPLTAAKRVKRTSLGVCRREEVISKMFSGAK